ncbi:MAG: HpsJ family protein [Coleofasciculus sp. S288]|nr:HpsJ family protein [Coleofasciculus sp. S288]
MKSSPAYAPFTALTLKVVGLILIVSSLLDYIILAIPFNPLQRAWQIGFTEQVVNQGIIPMVGIAFLVAGAWIGNVGGASSESRSSVGAWAFVLSSLLGLIFLLLVPLHFNNVAQESNAALQQVSQRATQAEAQLEARAGQISALVKDPKGLAQLKQQLSELDQAIETGRVPPEQQNQAQAYRQLLQTITQNPSKAISQELEAAQTKLRSGKLELEKQAKTRALKSALKTGLSSLLLAIGYIVIGWMGLRNSGGSSASSRKA